MADLPFPAPVGATRSGGDRRHRKAVGERHLGPDLVGEKTQTACATSPGSQPSSNEVPRVTASGMRSCGVPSGCFPTAPPMRSNCRGGRDGLSGKVKLCGLGVGFMEMSFLAGEEADEVPPAVCGGDVVCCEWHRRARSRRRKIRAGCVGGVGGSTRMRASSFNSSESSCPMVGSAGNLSLHGTPHPSGLDGSRPTWPVVPKAPHLKSGTGDRTETPGSRAGNKGIRRPPGG